MAARRGQRRPARRSDAPGTAPRPRPQRSRPPADLALTAAPPGGVLDGWALPPPRATYPLILRGVSYTWWRSLGGVIVGLSMFFLLTGVVAQAVVTVAWALTAGERNYQEYATEAYAFERPAGMLAVNLGIATLIPIAVLAMIFLHHVRPAWLISVQARPRLRYAGWCAAVAVVALTASLLLASLVEERVHFAPQTGFWVFLVVIVLTSPLQAAAEEVFFRGYLMQALGSLFVQPWVGVVLSSLVFALFHGTQNLPLFVDRLAFGLVAGWLVWRTGGLEAGIAAHVVNNVMAYVLAGLTTSIASVKAIREISWVDAGFDVGGFALFALGAYLIARRMNLERRVRA